MLQRVTQALHGINLPLSSTGQEYVFAEVFKALGLNETDLEGFFVGPAFLAWYALLELDS
jgi:alpha-N-acetylglucosaminidase